MAIKKIISVKKAEPVIKAKAPQRVAGGGEGEKLGGEGIVSEQVSPALEQYESGTKTRSKRACAFCQGKSNPSYTDLSALRRFLTDRAKIVAKERSGVCSKHQRQVAKNIKYARHLALLPFVPKV